MKVHPLSNAKGVTRPCELCAKPSHIQCSKCKVTFYCEESHQKTDFHGIHALICPLLGPLRIKDAVLGSEEERAERLRATTLQFLELLRISKTQAQKLLFQAQYDIAIPAALQSLRASVQVYGQDSIEVVYVLMFYIIRPAYLLLGEASIGLRQYEEAEKYLSLAKWAILKDKSGTERNLLKSRLHRNFGQLYLAVTSYLQKQEKFEAAINELSLDIYHSSLESGAESLTVCGGLYYLANTFKAMDPPSAPSKENSANSKELLVPAPDERRLSFLPAAMINQKTATNLAIYTEIIKIYRLQLSIHANEIQDTESTGKWLDSAQLAESVQILTHIFESRKKQTNLINAAESLLILSQVQFYCGCFELAKENASIAAECTYIINFSL